MKRITIKSLCSVLAIALGAIFLYSCSSTSVATNGLIQKRKYRKGFYFANNHSKRVKESKKLNVKEMQKNTDLASLGLHHSEGSGVMKYRKMPQVVADNSHSTKSKLLDRIKDDRVAKTASNIIKSIAQPTNKGNLFSNPEQRLESINNTNESTAVNGGSSSTMGIIALVCGILGIILLWFAGGILFDILAIVFGIVSHGDNLGKIGLILGIIGIVLWLIVFLLIIVILAAAASAA